MREYYIRREGDEDASGPYNLDQITSLFEAGKLEKDAYVYDIDTENWILIEECEELMKELFPEKKKLTLRSKDASAEDDGEEGASDEAEAGSTDESNDASSESTEKKKGPRLKRKAEEEEKKKSISVTAMLAQAEGREGDDPKGKSPIEKRAQAAFVGLRFATLFTFGSAISMVFLEWELALTADFIAMMKSPYLAFAAVDIILGFFLLLQVTEVFPLLRFRAAIGLGALSVLFLTSGDPKLAAANTALAISTYFSTATLSLPRAAIPCGIFGTLSLAIYGWQIIWPLFA